MSETLNSQNNIWVGNKFPHLSDNVPQGFFFKSHTGCNALRDTRLIRNTSQRTKWLISQFIRYTTRFLDRPLLINFHSRSRDKIVGFSLSISEFLNSYLACLMVAITQFRQVRLSDGLLPLMTLFATIRLLSFVLQPRGELALRHERLVHHVPARFLAVGNLSFLRDNKVLGTILHMTNGGGLNTVCIIACAL